MRLFIVLTSLFYTSEALKCYSGVPLSDKMWSTIFTGRRHYDNMVHAECRPETNFCVIEMTRDKLGNLNTVHGCGTESHCEKAGWHLGKDRSTLKGLTYCCEGELCNSSSPQEPFGSPIRLKRDTNLRRILQGALTHDDLKAY